MSKWYRFDMIASYLELLLIAFFCGVFAYAYGWAVGVVLFVSGVVWFLVEVRAARGRRAPPKWWLIILISLFFFCGYERRSMAEDQRTVFSHFLENNPRVTLVGVISSDPQEHENGSSAYLDVSTIRIGEQSIDLSGSVRLGLPRYPAYWRDQEMVVDGAVKLALNGITWTMPQARVVSVEDPGGVTGAVLSVRQEIVNRLQLLFPGSVGGFLMGVLAGGSRGMSRDIIEDVRATGLTHVIAVSGYNVTIVLNLVVAMFAWLPRRWKFLPEALFLFLFLLLVGMSASALRAAIMGVLTVFAVASGRSRSLLLALLWSGVGMTLWHPFMLTEDRGFQLSFLATIGVCYLAPLVTAFIPENISPSIKNLILEPFLTTFAVYLVTIPVLFSFEQFSLIGLITNIIFVPFIPYAMLTAATVLGGSFVFWPLALFLGHLAAIFVDLAFAALHWFATLPFASVQVPQMSLAVVIIYSHGLMILRRFLSMKAPH